MKSSLKSLVSSLGSAALVIWIWSLVIASASAQVPQFINFQGRLLQGTNLYNGSANLQFRLFTNSVGGTSLCTSTNQATVTDGLYATAIGQFVTAGHLGTALANSEVWLEVVVNGATLSPRERLSAVPYALKTEGLLLMTNGSVVLNPGASNRVSDFTDYGTIGGGKGHVIDFYSDYSVVGGGLSNVVSGNSGSTTIAGGAGNMIGRFAGSATIGGGQLNVISNFAQGSVIAGGVLNRIDSNANYTAIGGGTLNQMGEDTDRAVIAGGSQNVIGTGTTFAAIGGGLLNAIAPGGHYGTVPGGRRNVATNYAFAAGRRAKALHTGAFVWGDSTDADVASTANNEVTFRASGGFRVQSGELLAEQGVRVGATGTAFARVQAATATLGPGTNTMSYAVVFPSAFGTVPRVQITLRNDPLFDVPDTFAATLRRVTATNFVINVQRVDSAGGWAQQLRLDWLAWE